MLKKFVRLILLLWEHIICRINKNKTIPGSPYGLMRYRLALYKGKMLCLDDDTILNKEDHILELHLSNIALAKGVVGNSQVASDLQLIPLIRSELKLIAFNERNGRFGPGIKAIGGITFHVAGIRRLGFKSYPAENSFVDFFILTWMRLLHWAFSNPKTIVLKKRHPDRQIVYFYMSMHQFIQRYGAHE